TPKQHRIYNLGSGTGFSVREVIEACRMVTGHPLPTQPSARRAGDPAVLVASNELARRELGWRPARSDLHRIVTDAWRFTREHLAGNG
ncbi:MAG: UDP-glucose 4-epimerase GalE, partial [Pseudonocardia sp.]|nr:UDP-glucose 4-epimerase GalE [Pseudonocardia sp.]